MTNRSIIHDYLIITQAENYQAGKQVIVARQLGTRYKLHTNSEFRLKVLGHTILPSLIQTQHLLHIWMPSAIRRLNMNCFGKSAHKLWVTKKKSVLKTHY